MTISSNRCARGWTSVVMGWVTEMWLYFRVLWRVQLSVSAIAVVGSIAICHGISMVTVAMVRATKRGMTA